MPTLFTAMTWNLENLFLFRRGSKEGPKSQDVFDRKLDNLASIISAVDPDIMAAQEIGDPEAFELLNKNLAKPYPHVLVSQFKDARGIRVGFLSRHAIIDQGDLSVFTDDAFSETMIYQKARPEQKRGGRPTKPDFDFTAMGRGALRVNFRIGEHELCVVTAHLKSKLATYPGGRRFAKDDFELARGAGAALIRRAAEAVALRNYCADLIFENDLPLVLLGDMNDEPQAVTSQILLGPEDNSLEREDKGDDTRLYNLADLIIADHRYSRVYKKRRELIDHIMVTRDLRLAATFVDSFVPGTEPINESTEARRDKTLSDHAPVFARFTLP